MRQLSLRIAAVLLGSAAPLAAQRPTPIPPADTTAPAVIQPRVTCGAVGLPDCPPPRFWAGIGVDVAQPIGEFREYADVSGGVNLHGTVLLTPGSPLGLRVQGGFISYGNERERMYTYDQFGRPLFPAELSTSNSYTHFGAGPELALRRGALRPYVGGTVGVGYFSTSQSLSSRDQYYCNDQSGSCELWSEKLQSDAILATTGFGGLRIAMGSLRSPFTIDVGARYVRNGEAEFVEEGGVEDDGQGNVVVAVTRSRADFVTYQLGVSFGFGGGRR